MTDLVYATASDVLSALRLRYAEPRGAWALLECVPNGTGGRADRWADAVVMSLWPSRGIDLHGIEIKVSRSDLLRELKSPHKAEAVAQHCDFWWIAVGSTKVSDGVDLPRTWGLLVPDKKKGMKVAKESTKLKGSGPKIDRNFVASMFRRASEHFDPQKFRNEGRYSVLEDDRQEAIESARKQWESEIELEKQRTATHEENAKRLQKQLDAIRGSNYHPSTIARAVELLNRLQGWQGSAKLIEAAIRHMEIGSKDLLTASEGMQAGLDLAMMLEDPN